MRDLINQVLDVAFLAFQNWIHRKFEYAMEDIAGGNYSGTTTRINLQLIVYSQAGIFFSKGRRENQWEIAILMRQPVFALLPLGQENIGEPLLYIQWLGMPGRYHG